MLEDLTRTRLSHRRKISTDAIPALREKLGTGSNKAVNWIGNQIRKVRRGSDSESDDSASLWGTSFEIYPDEPLGPATALAEGYVPLSRFHSQKRSTDLTHRSHTVQADHIFSLDQCKLDERQPLIESETSNPPSTPRTIEGPRKRRQKTLDPEEPRRLLAPVELYDRPWSETNFGFGASNRRDTEKTFGSTYKNPSRHATTPSQSKLSFRVLLPHP